MRLVLFVLACIAASVHAQVCARPNFLPYTQVLASPPSESRTFVTAADFDGDGDGDVAFVRSDGSLEVALDTGGGALGPPTVVLTSSGLLGVVCEDVNSDDRADVFLAYATSLSFVLNVGGAFPSPPTPIASGFSFGILAVAVGDISGDDHADVAVCGGGRSGGNVAWAPGGGDGSFGVLATVPGEVDTTFVSALALVDFDGDGHLDVFFSELVPPSLDGVLAYVHNPGTGTLLGATVSYPELEPGAGYQSLEFAQLSAGDSNPDVVGLTITATITVGLGNGVDSFPIVRAGSAVGGRLTIIDINGDGHLDLVTIPPTRDHAQVVIGDATGLLSASPAPLTPILSTGTIEGHTVLDLGANALYDVVAVIDSDATRDFAVFTDAGTPVFDAQPTTIVAGITATQLLQADLSGTGVSSLVAGTSTEIVAIANVAATRPIPFSVLVADSRIVAVADLDFSGSDDVAVCSRTAYHVAFFYAATMAHTLVTIPRVSPATTTTGVLVIGDITGDVWPDLVFGDQANGLIEVVAHHPTVPQAFLPPFHLTPLLAVPQLSSIALADFSGNGVLSIVAVNRNGGATTMLTSIFSPPPTGPLAEPWLRVEAPAPPGDGREHVVAADVNGDAALDILTNSWSGGTASFVWIANDGSGAFPSAPLVVHATSTSVPLIFDAADIDVDNDVDIAYAVAGDIVVLYNDGAATFSAATLYASSAASGVSIIDFNNDAVPDVVTTALEAFAQRFPPSLILQPLLYPTPLSPTPSVSDLASVLAHRGRCSTIDILFAPTVRSLTRCPLSGIRVPPGASWSLAHVTFDCAGFGSAFHVAPGATLILANVTITGTSGAPAIAVAGVLVATNLTITHATSPGAGGAIHAFNGGSVTVTAGSITASTAFDSGGGAVALTSGSTAYLAHLHMSHNVAANGGSGGALLVSASSSATLHTCSFVSNTAASGGAAALVHASSARATATTFAANSATLGGGVALLDAASAWHGADNTWMLGNVATWGGCIATIGAPTAAPASSLVTPLVPRSAGVVSPPLVFATAASTTFAPGACRAAFGGVVFECDAGANLTFVTLPQHVFDWSGARAGHLAFGCAAIVSALPDTTPPSSLHVATRPLALALSSPAPVDAVLSGRAFGPAWPSVTAVDAYGAVRTVPDLSLSVSSSALDINVRFKTGVAAGQLADLVLVRVATPSTAAKHTSLTLQSDADPDLTLLVAVNVGFCPPGFGAEGEPAVGDVVACVACVDGSFSDATSFEHCETYAPCPSGAHRPELNTSVAVPCSCRPGWWSGSRASTECAPCPSGASCAGGNALPEALAGFAAMEGGVFVACPDPNACGSGGTCRKHTRGRLCFLCTDGHYRLGSECRVCSPLVNMLTRVGLLVLIVAGVVAMTLFNLHDNVYFRFVVGLIVLTALQVAATFSALALGWSDATLLFFDVASVFNLNVELLALECVFESSSALWVAKYILVLVLPLVIITVMALVATSVLLPATRVGILSATPRQLYGATRRTSLHIVALLQFVLVRNPISVFDCVAGGNATWYMASNPEIECYSGTWAPLAVASSLAVMVYGVAVPLGVFWVLRQARSSDDILFFLKYAFFVSRFNTSHWWFEIEVMVRKTAIVCALAFPRGAESKANYAALVLMLAVLSLALRQPYRSTFHNLVAITSLTAVAALIASATFAHAFLRDAVSSASVALLLFLAVVATIADLFGFFRPKSASIGSIDDDGVELRSTTGSIHSSGVRFETTMPMGASPIHVSDTQSSELHASKSVINNANLSPSPPLTGSLSSPRLTRSTGRSTAPSASSSNASNDNDNNDRGSITGDQFFVSELLLGSNV